MSKPKPGPMPQVEVDDPAAAFERAREFARRMLAIPKGEIEKRGTAHKTKGKRKR